MQTNKEDLKKLYKNEYVEKYERNSLSRLKRLEKYFDLKKEDIVADFACGNGMLLEIIMKDIKEYHGVDFSEEMITAAKRRSAKLDFSKGFFYAEDIEKFSEKNIGKFDVGFSMDFSEHVYDDDWVRILTAIKKTLKPKGVLYLHTPNAEFFIEILKNKGILTQFPEHIRVRNAFDNMRMLKDAGFDKVEIKHISHYELWLKPFALISYIPFLGKYFSARLFIKAQAK